MLTEEQRKQITDTYRVFIETMPDTLVMFAQHPDHEIRRQAHKLYFTGVLGVAMLTGDWLNGVVEPTEEQLTGYLTNIVNYHQEVKDLIEKM